MTIERTAEDVEGVNAVGYFLDYHVVIVYEPHLSQPNAASIHLVIILADIIDPIGPGSWTGS